MNGLPSAPASVAEEEGEGEEDEQAATGGECLSPEQRCALDNGGGDAGAVITPSAAAQGGPPQLGRASNTPVRRQMATDIPIIPEVGLMARDLSSWQHHAFTGRHLCTCQAELGRPRCLYIGWQQAVRHARGGALCAHYALLLVNQ
jgi:hypothetical protein